jgi:SSS family transporter
MKALFGFWDWVIVISYIGIVTWLGTRFYRRKASADDYFLGGRGMSAIPVAISLLAADLSAATYMGVPAWAYRFNWELFLLSCTYLLAVPFVIVIFMPFYMRFRFFTGYEYLERRFDLKCRLLVSGLFLLTRGSHIAIAIYVPSIALRIITGLPMHVCIPIMGVFTTVYTALGGMKAVIWTDVMQFSVLMLGTFSVLWLAIGRVPGGLLTVYHVSSQAGRLHMFNFSLNPTEMTSVWAMLIGGTVMTLSTLATDQAYLQRYFTTKSLEEGRRSILLDSIIVIPVVALLYIVGDVLFAFYHFHPDRLQGLPLVDAILPFFVVHELGGLISGLVTASIFAASMAVMGAGLNSLTTVTAVDFFQRLGGRGGNVVRVGRWGTVVWGIAVTFGALFADRLGPVINAFNIILSYLGGPTLGVFLLGMTSKRATANGAFWGGISSFIIVTVVAYRTHISFFYYGIIGLMTTLAFGYLFSLLQPARPADQLTGLVLGLPQGTPNLSAASVSPGGSQD